MKVFEILVEILANIVYLLLGATCIRNAVCYFKQQRWYLFGLEVILAILLIHNLLG